MKRRGVMLFEDDWKVVLDALDQQVLRAELGWTTLADKTRLENIMADIREAGTGYEI